jgi:hypothetical protein
MSADRKGGRPPRQNTHEKRVQFLNPDAKIGRPETYRSELSVTDQRWGILFDEDGNPTARLGQFLRGLANRMVRFPIL